MATTFNPPLGFAQRPFGTHVVPTYHFTQGHIHPGSIVKAVNPFLAKYFQVILFLQLKGSGLSENMAGILYSPRCGIVND